MSQERIKDEIFNVPHSLPSNAHSTAIASRTPSGPSRVESSKYLPAYGGMFELPGLKLKNNGLREGVPFSPNPYSVWSNNPDCDTYQLKVPASAECLAVTSSLQDCDSHESGKSFLMMRARGSTLNLQLAKSIPWNGDRPESVNAITYSRVPYSYVIRGLKYYEDPGNHVIVNFREGVKIISLNNLGELSRGSGVCNEGESGRANISAEFEVMDAGAGIDQEAVSLLGSFPALKKSPVTDSCLSTSRNLLGVASSSKQELQVRIFDLEHSKCLSSILKTLEDEAKILSAMTERPKLRTFVPSKPVFEELLQIESDPSHLINSVVTTTTKVSQIDPRAEAIAGDYMDKFRLANVTPTEQFRRVQFSRKNDYQLYLMTNEKLRVIDKRFRSRDMNILDHMLDSSARRMMTMKLVEPAQTSLGTHVETLCLSAYGRLCFVSFDQSHRLHSFFESSGRVVNPYSMHQPIHVPSPFELSGQARDEVYGLAVSSGNIFDNKCAMFSTLQLSTDGRVLIRGFPEAHAEGSMLEPSLKLRSGEIRTVRPNLHESVPHFANEAIGDPHLDSEQLLDPDYEHDYIDMMLDSDILEAEEFGLRSKRAKAKNDSIKESFRF